MNFSANSIPALAGLIALFALAQPAAAQVQAARIDPEDRARVLVVDPTSDDPRVLKSFDGSVVDTTPSPSGRLVGVIVAHSPTQKGAARIFRLHVLDESGEVYRIVDHVQKFVFSPLEQYVAVIRGHGYEGGPGFFPDNTEILGLDGPDLGPIPGLEKATDLEWSQFDDDGLVLLARVYDGQSTIVEYILRTRVVVPTEYLGLHFSPDGKYYYLTPGEAVRAHLCEAGKAYDSCVRVYERNGYWALPLELDPSHRRPLAWADDNRMLIANERNHDCHVFDIAANRSTERFSAVDWRWNPRRGFVVRRAGNKPNFRKLGRPKLRAVLQ